ncbi:MAG: PilN domain-containing protein, partial [Deltaproteobacteria bacterium]|nr:PilN domain-containing protein [Deltaproteobacteria bacterium]
NIEQAKRQRDELIAQSARYKEVIERINLAQKKEEDIKKRLAVIDSLLQGRIYWSEILRNITHLIPDGIWFASMSTYDLVKGAGNVQAEQAGGKSVKFNGTALSNSRIAEFVFALENSQFFGNVLLAYSQKREFHGRDLYDFEITADLKEAKR